MQVFTVFLSFTRKIQNSIDTLSFIEFDVKPNLIKNYTVKSLYNNLL